MYISLSAGGPPRPPALRRKTAQPINTTTRQEGREDPDGRHVFVCPPPHRLYTAATASPVAQNIQQLVTRGKPSSRCPHRNGQPTAKPAYRELKIVKPLTAFSNWLSAVDAHDLIEVHIPTLNMYLQPRSPPELAPFEMAHLPAASGRRAHPPPHFQKTS